MKWAIFIGALGVFVPVLVLASIGVGIGTGKIHVDQPLNPGTTTTLPGIPVLNTGDEPSQYGMSIEYHLDQPQMRPDREWFSFEPETFHLDPHASRIIRTTINLPVRVPPGDYFAYIEAHPVQEDVPGQSRVGVAAAAKLYFTVEPATTLQGLYYAALSLYARNAGWIRPLAVVLLAALLLSIARRYLHFNVSLKK